MLFLWLLFKQTVLKMKLKRGRNSIQVILNLTNRLARYISGGSSECNWAQGSVTWASASDDIPIDYWLGVRRRHSPLGESVTAGIECILGSAMYLKSTGISLKKHRSLKHEDLQLKQFHVQTHRWGVTTDMKY